MRRILTAILTIGWAACFVSQAAHAPHVEGGGAASVIATMLTYANVGLAAAFICLAAACFGDIGSTARTLRRATNACFCMAAAISLAGIVSAQASGHAVLSGVLFLQLTALLASYLVIWREEKPLRVRPPANDNEPLSARLMAASAARLAMMENLERRRAANGGEMR